MTDPPVTFLIPINSLSRTLGSNFSTAWTTNSLKNYLLLDNYIYIYRYNTNLELRAVSEHFNNVLRLSSGFSFEIFIEKLSNLVKAKSNAYLKP